MPVFCNILELVILFKLTITAENNKSFVKEN